MRYKHAEEIAKAAEDLHPVVLSSTKEVIEVAVSREAWERLQAALAKIQDEKREGLRAARRG